MTFELTETEKTIWASVFVSEFARLARVAVEINAHAAAAARVVSDHGGGANYFGGYDYAQNPPTPALPWYGAGPWAAGNVDKWAFEQASGAAWGFIDQSRTFAESLSAFNEGNSQPETREQLSQIFGIDPPA